MLYRLIRKFFSTSSPTLPLHATFLEVGKTDVPIVTNDIVLDMDDDGDDGVGGDGGGEGGDGGGDGDGGDDGGDDGDDDDRLTDIVVCVAVGAMWIGVVGCLVLVFVVVLG